MNTDKFAEILKMASEAIDDKGGREVIKTMKMRPEWVKMHDELEVLCDEAKAIVSKIETKRNLMWATIENDLQMYDVNMQIDPETNIVEIYKKK